MLHLANGVGYEHCQEVVAFLHAVDYACSDGVDVFEHSGIFHAVDVGCGDGVAVFCTAERQAESFGSRNVLTADSEICRAVERHLFGVAGAGHYEKMVVGHMEIVAHVVGDEHIFAGNDSFHGRYDVFFADVDGELFEMAFEIWRRHHEQERVGLPGNVVDVGGKFDALNVELHVGQVGRVVAEPLELFDAVVATHVPHYGITVAQQEFGKGGGPAAASHHGYTSGKVFR